MPTPRTLAQWLLPVAIACAGCEESRATPRTQIPSSDLVKTSADAPGPATRPAKKSDGDTLLAKTASPPAGGPLLLDVDGGSVAAAKAQRILHVGDSMVPLVGNYLRPILQARGDTYSINSVTSSSTLEWGGEKRLLQKAMYKFDPQVILISLGSNELFDPTPERRAASIRQIVTDTRGRPCLWLGPPAWKKDLGFIQVLKKNLGHCRYLDSTRLNLPRMADGRHPDWTGGYRWASATWKELGGESAVPTGNAPKP